MAIKWSKINLQRNLIPYWNPANKGYKISYKLTWGNHRVQKTAWKTLSQILWANTVNKVVSN